LLNWKLISNKKHPPIGSRDVLTIKVIVLALLEFARVLG
jgi:hypothetical protein